MTSLKEIAIPDLGDADEVEVLEIQHAVGDSIDVGDVLLTVESDKAAMDIPSEQSGQLVELLMVVGDTVRQGQLFAKIQVVVDTAELDVDRVVKIPEPPQLLETESIAPVRRKAPVAEYRQPKEDTPAKQSLAPSGPASRRLARELGVDISEVVGSGKRGRIAKEDVKAHAKALLHALDDSTNATAIQSSQLPDITKYGATHAEDLSKIESISSRNMQRAWREIPHAWLQQNIDITTLDQGRKLLKAENPDITLTAFLIKAMATNLQMFPRFNCVLDVHDQQLIYRDYIDVGVAVDTPRGLVIAVIRKASKMNVASIGAELSRLSGLARQGSLQSADMQGAGMTLSSLGGLGVDGLQPIVNWPEVAIVGVARASMIPVFIGDNFEPRLVLPMTLGFDHRVINGADGARFLSSLQGLLSEPMRLLVNG